MRFSPASDAAISLFALLSSFFILCFSLSGCSSGNSVVIKSEPGAPALRLTDRELYINPGLLGLPPDSSLDVNTSSDNSMTFNLDIPDSGRSGASQDSAAF